MTPRVGGPFEFIEAPTRERAALESAIDAGDVGGALSLVRSRYASYSIDRLGGSASPDFDVPNHRRAVQDWDIQYLLRQFGPMDDGTRRQLWADLRGFALPEIADFRRQRVLADGAAVTDTAAGTQVKFAEESYFDVWNFLGMQVSVESGVKGRQVNIRGGGGGADCMFNYLVSLCFSTLDDFSEGKAFNSLSGCTFWGYTTLGGALTHARAGTNESVTIFVCSGTYDEAITWPTDGGSLNQVEIVGVGGPIDGSSGNSTILQSTAVGTSAFTVTTNPVAMTLRNLSVTGAVKAIAHTSGINMRAQWENVRFGAIDVASLLTLRADRCWFDGAISCSATGSPESLVFSDSLFSAAVDVSTAASIDELIFDAGCRHNGEGVGVKVGDFRTFRHHGIFVGGTTGNDRILMAGGTGIGKDFEITSTFRTPPGTGGANIRITVGSGQNETFNGRIAANFIAPGGAVSSSTAFIKLQGSSSHKIFGISVVGSVFGSGDNAGTYIEDRGGYSIIADHVNNCTFGPNAPSGKALYNITNGSMNKIDGVIVSSGVPSHTDNEGALYKDSATDSLYINTSAGTGNTWALLSTPSGIGQFWPIAQTPTALTISAGAVTVSANQYVYTIDTEAAAASDDLDTISGLVANRLYLFKPANDAGTVVFKHETGNLHIAHANADLTADDIEDFVLVWYDGTTVMVMGGGGGGSGATLSDGAGIDVTASDTINWLPAMGWALAA